METGTVWVGEGLLFATVLKHELLYSHRPKSAPQESQAAQWLKLLEKLDMFTRKVWVLLSASKERDRSTAIMRAIQEAERSSTSRHGNISKEDKDNIARALLALSKWHDKNKPYQVFTAEAMSHMTGEGVEAARPSICVDRSGEVYLLDHHRIRAAQTARVPIEVSVVRHASCVGFYH
eukprot:TRINITY_DN4898_c0_g1_i1.p1 TRINITY_DN4898_c0_g1~~TRINITY_DN4898_c0_g1_i1.p1  ORF type:complete len:178 (+),score=15.32 TRINITY_DN4898_c0_g1_i1:625-1158(+)